MSALAGAPGVHADDRPTWRAWLEANHGTARGAWLVSGRRGTGPPFLDCPGPARTRASGAAPERQARVAAGSVGAGTCFPFGQ